MKWFLYVIIIIIWHEAFSIPENCEYNDTNIRTECNYTDYHSYVKCARNRVKRQVDCKEETSFSSTGSADACSECDCNYCNQSHCNSPCNTCCSHCKTRACCTRTCQGQCTTSTCRRSCRKTCTDRIATTNGNVTTHNIPSSQLHNVTTVINLQTLINNTNIIDMPVNVNNTNINNIGIRESWPHAITNSLSSKCCQIIGPRQCAPCNQFPFVKCYHYRKHVCSNICQSGIMHAQPHQVCDERPSGPPNCQEQTIYIPQPQPKCVSTSTWPYLMCGIKQICDGCYSEGKHCPQPCYNIGPYHRPSSWFGSSGSEFSSPGFGFSSPSAYPSYLGLPENQFSFELPGNPEAPLTLPHEEGNLSGNPEDTAPMYVKSNNSLSGNDVIEAEVVQPTNPATVLDNVPHSVSIKAIKSSGPVESDATIGGACGVMKVVKPTSVGRYATKENPNFVHFISIHIYFVI